MESPRYRIKQDTPINGTIYPGGAEISYGGWPTAAFEPLNEAAKRMKNYFGPHHPTRPHSPFNQLVGGIYLPAVLPPSAPAIPNSDPGMRLPSPVMRGTTPDMPAYRAAWISVRRVGQVDVEAGAEFYFLGWPTEGFEPINEAAEQVAAYYAANKDNPALLPSPWCRFKLGVVLPTLPGSKAPDRDLEDAAFALAKGRYYEQKDAEARRKTREERSAKRGNWQDLEA